MDSKKRLFGMTEKEKEKNWDESEHVMTRNTLCVVILSSSSSSSSALKKAGTTK